MHIQFITTGGTIDKIYFDAMSQFEVGESQVEHILREANETQLPVRQYGRSTRPYRHHGTLTVEHLPPS